MEFTHQWQPFSPQPSHPDVQNGVQVSGCSPSCWNPRIQFTPLNPQRNSLPPIWHNNCTLPLCRIAGFAPAWELFTKLNPPSHAITPSWVLFWRVAKREGWPQEPAKSCKIKIWSWFGNQQSFVPFTVLVPEATTLSQDSLLFGHTLDYLFGILGHSCQCGIFRTHMSCPA